jgi:hypothetical protein
LLTWFVASNIDANIVQVVFGQVLLGKPDGFFAPGIFGLMVLYPILPFLRKPFDNESPRCLHDRFELIDTGVMPPYREGIGLRYLLKVAWQGRVVLLG